MTSREEIYEAFFQLAKGTPGFASVHRRWIDVASVNEFPTMMIRQAGETVERTVRGAPPRITARVELQVLLSAPSNTADPVSPPINDMLDALQAHLEQPSPSALDYDQNLGIEAVSRVYVNGQVEIYETDPVSYVYVPVTIVFNLG